MTDKRVVMVTGAGNGLGRALALRFGAAGDFLVLLARTESKVAAVAEEIGADALPIACDVQSADSVKAAFTRLRQQVGRIDVLINNAGVYDPVMVAAARDHQIYTAALTNLAGPIFCAREAIPLMQRGSHILNISSETVAMHHAMFSLYQSSKAGLERFSEALRSELAPDGIRVTTVRAGSMRGEDSRAPSTDMAVLRCFADENAKRGLNLSEAPSSSFASVAEFIWSVTHLPDDLGLGHVSLEGRRP